MSIRRCLAVVTALIWASAAIAQDFKAQVRQIAAEAETAYVEGTSLELSFRHKTDEVLKAEAAFMDMPVEAYKALAQQGFDAVAAGYRPVQRTTFFENARFGTAGQIPWALVPSRTQLRDTVNDKDLVSCDIRLYFRQADRIYFHPVGQARDQKILIGAHPTLVLAFEDGLPDCPS